MPMYNLLEYSKNYEKTTGSLWNYYRDQPSNPLSTTSESFKYKTRIVGKTPPNNDSLTDTEVVIPLKYLRNFWRNLDIPLNAVLNPPVVPPSGATFQITDTKLYVPVITLSKENDIKPLEKLKFGFTRTIK